MEEVQLGTLLSLLTATLSHTASWSFMHRDSQISWTERSSFMTASPMQTHCGLQKMEVEFNAKFIFFLLFSEGKYVRNSC